MRSQGRASARFIVALVVLSTLLLATGAPSASAAPKAAPGYAYLATFGSGEISTFGGSWNALATDSQGNVLAADPFAGGRIFAPDPALGATPLTTFSVPGLPTDVTVDRSNDAAYFARHPFEGNGIVRYLSDGAAVPTYTQDPGYGIPGVPVSAFVVNSATHDLYVAEGGESIQRYSSAGAPLSTIATPGVISQRLALAPDGSIYAAQQGSATVHHYAADGTELAEVQNADNVQAIAVDPATGSLVVDTGSLLKQFTSTGTLASQSPARAGSGQGLAFDATGKRLYEFSGTSADAYVLATVPGVEVPAVSDVQPHSAHVTAEVDPGVDPEGSPGDPPPAGSEAHFEYRVKGETDWQSTADQELASPGVTTVDAVITGIKGNLDYEVRTVAGNSAFPENFSSAVVFHTPVTAPEVETTPATEITETSAVLNGKVESVGLQTTYHFEYGTSTAYGSRIPLELEAVVGNAHESRPFNNTIAGLQPGTTYHFRIVAKNSIGETLGGDQSFTTSAAGSIPTRAYEQVTPAEKEGVAVIPRLGFQAKSDGSAVSYTVKAGSQSSTVVGRSVAYRDPFDWRPRFDTDPPLNVGGQGLVIHTTLAVSDDLEHSFVVTNRRLNSEGGYESGANLYRGDVRSGTYELIGASNAPNAFSSFTAAGTSSGKYLAGAPDFSWVIFSSERPLLGGAPVNAMYRWSVADGLEVLSVLPNGDMSAAVRTYITPYPVASTDGSKAYYVAQGGAEEGVFLRENGGAPTPVSVSEGDPTTPQPANLVGVTRDGRYAFIASRTNGSPLTNDAPGTRGDVYRYDSSDGSLTYLGIQAYVYPAQGLELGIGVFGVGQDGNTFWFLNEDTPFGGSQSPGTFRVWHNGEVHTVPGATFGIGGEERVSSNGRYFLYYRSVSGARPAYLYDAYTGDAECVSCRSDGTPVDATISEGGAGDLLFSNSIPLGVTDEGIAYFDTTARLLAADVNGTRDVYAYHAGDHTLISPGNQPFSAAFATVTPDGDDVFFTTDQKLVGRDIDQSTDIYDARLGGGLSAQSPPPAQICLRDDCKATPGAGPELPFGGSEALAGPGNVQKNSRKRCGKGAKVRKVKGKKRCVKHSKRKATKRGANRRDGR